LLQKKIDTSLNKTILDVILFSGAGYMIGCGVSLFFHKKFVIRNMVAGVGGSYAFILNQSQFK